MTWPIQIHGRNTQTDGFWKWKSIVIGRRKAEMTLEFLHCSW